MHNYYHSTLKALLVGLLYLPIFSGAVVSETKAAETAPGLYDRLSASAVEVLVDGQLAGSGCLVTSSGLVLSAAHFLAPDKPIEVITSGSRPQAAKLVALDPAHDLALLQLPAAESKYPALGLADRMPAPGSDVFLFGAPLFRHGVLFRGSVARRETTFEYVDRHYVEAIHIAAASPKGVSGGPWVNAQGEIVAVQSAMLSLGDAVQGLAIAAPVDAIRRLLGTRKSQIATTLGAAVEETWEQPPAARKQLATTEHGLVVRAVRAGGPLAIAGVASGAVILKCDGERVYYRDALLRAVRAKQPGETIKLAIANRDKPRLVEVTLGSLPERPAQ